MNETTTMHLNNERHFVLTLAEAEWLASAFSTDTHRPVLTLAALGNWDGSAVLVATDRRRLHLLRLGDVPEGFPLEPMTDETPIGDTSKSTKPLDLYRVICEARYNKAKHIAVSHDLCEVKVGEADSKKSRWEPVYAPAFPEGVGSYPQFARVIPQTRRPVAELFAMNSHFLADATMLAREAAMKTVMWSEDARVGPIVFQPDSKRPRWTAVVMPMELDCNLEVAQ